GHGALARELLDLAAPVGHPVQRLGADAEAAHLDDLRVIAGLAQGLVGVGARMPARPGRLDGGPADVEPHAGGSLPRPRGAGVRRTRGIALPRAGTFRRDEARWSHRSADGCNRGTG